MITTLAAILLAASPVVATPIKLPDPVRASLERRVDQGINAGIVVGIVEERSGKVETAFWSFGVLETGKPDEVGPDTIFEIGSITKTFTATLLADMVERGDMKLEDPINRFLPKGVKSPSRSGQTITLEHLATHRSGLPRLPDNFMPANDGNPYADLTPETLHEFLSKHELSRDVGEAYEYSNLGVGLLGHALALATGKSYGELVSERICRPLKMRDTGTTLSRSQQNRFATGHAGAESVRHWTFLSCMAGCGALRSTARDMTRYLSANMGLVDSPLSAAMRNAHKIRRDTNSPYVHIGLGWHINTRFDTTVVWHNGGTGGFRTFCGFVPDRKRGVVVLSNTSRSVDDLGFHLLESKYDLDDIPQTVTVPNKVLEEYVGHYQLQPGALFDITTKDGRLFAQMTGQESYEVYPESKTTFFYTIVEARLIFDRDANGKVHQVRLDQFGMKRPAKRLTDYTPPPPRVAIQVDKKILRRYEGRYQLVPGVIFDVHLRDDQLTVHITGQSRQPVYAESKTKFFYKSVEAQITFVLEGTDVVNELILHQGGLDRRAKRIE